MGLINKEQEYQDQEDWSNDVEKLKGYKEFAEKVEWWAKQKDKDEDVGGVIEGSYEIVYDDKLGWCVDVKGYVSFNGLYIEEIPFQFRNVSSAFWCRNCKNLTSLKGCPKEVGGNFYCYACGKEFTKEYIRSLCNVKGIILN